jgi:MinD superfamily P-loop ATPase
MRIAIASGKGGTGKTTIAVNLAFVAATGGESVTYLDCDVEEPDGHIFLSPEIVSRRRVTIPVPQVDESLCSGCGLCAQFCEFKAIVSIPDRVLTFHELCHGCGGCTLLCPDSAISEAPREIGSIETGRVETDRAGKHSEQGNLTFVHGILDVGMALSPPVIRAVKEHLGDSGLSVIDAPPGAACPMVEAVRHADYVVLVAEPTPFGLHDLDITMKVTNELGLPAGVVINRSGLGGDGVERYCRREGVDVLARFPDDRRIAEIYSTGGLVAAELPWFREHCEALLDALRCRISGIGLRYGQRAHADTDRRR